MSDATLSRFDSNRRYTYADYLNWTNDERWELVDGVPYAMSPAPSRKHQEVLGELSRQFANYLVGKPCRSYIAPFDVRLFAEDKSDEQIVNVVQPDLTVVCDDSKLDDRGCKGTPDLVVEILSPATGKQDRWLKYKLYERVGVKEYWIVDPLLQTVEVFILDDERYILSGVFGNKDMLRVTLFEDLEIDLRLVFN
ncbi:Uma2 family endonuclease [Aneurinibacillus sp. UBA3580]|jgi:Uma2 family endonuclease|uniref:Uma2 family endonuclease n=1 Tax=Aneurinibacillus sp. UBA3580 TaxID=1946041 RepID=UPI00257B2C38|nr:Uma2 family endonuclease [Aneurinibacillus sp. UBA3580]